MYIYFCKDFLCTHAVRLHNDGMRDVRKNIDGVSSGFFVEESVALKVKSMDVCLCSQPG